MKTKSIIVGLMLVCGLTGIAQATLLEGKTVGYQYYFPDLSTPYSNASNGNYLVGADVEISNAVDSLAQMDVSDSNLLVSFLPPQSPFMSSTGSFTFSPFNGFVISDVFGLIDDFTSVTINSITNMAGFDSSRISFDANHIWINWQGLDFDGNTTVVSIDINQGQQQVPEPGSLALLGLALIGVVVSRHRKA